jgi:hypothetical protein
MLMPGLSGTDVLDVLRRAGLTVPVILMSGHEAAMPEGFSESSENRSIYGGWPNSLRAAGGHGQPDRA